MGVWRRRGPSWCLPMTGEMKTWRRKRRRDDPPRPQEGVRGGGVGGTEGWPRPLPAPGQGTSKGSWLQDRTAISSTAIKQIGVCGGSGAGWELGTCTCVYTCVRARGCVQGVSRPCVCPRVWGLSPPTPPAPCAGSLSVCTSPCTHPRVWVLSSAEAGCPGGCLGGGVGSAAGATGLRRLGRPSPWGAPGVAAEPQTGRPEEPGSSPEVFGLLPPSPAPRQPPGGLTLG